VPATTPYRFCHIEGEHALEEYAALLRLAFPGEAVNVLGKRLYDVYPGMSPRNFFSLWDGDRMVATLNLIPMIWSLEGVPLSVAEMGLVATHPKYRHRGLQRLLNTEFDKRLVEDGYDLAAIEGIPYFYRQFGYEYSVTLDEWASIPLAKLPTQAMPGISPLQTEEISVAMSLLKASQIKYLVQSIRSPQEWATQEKAGILGEHKSTTYTVKVGGNISAYFRVGIESKIVLLHEIAETSASTSTMIAAFLRRLGEENGATELVSRESYIEHFSKYLIELGATKRRPYAWQTKVIDHAQILEKIKPVFEERIKHSNLNGYTGTIPLNLYFATLTLSFENGVLLCVKRSPSEQKGDIKVNPKVFPKMLLGSRSIGELEAEYPDVTVSPQYREIMNIMFPKGESHIHTTY